MKTPTLLAGMAALIVMTGCAGPTTAASSASKTETLPATTAEVARKDLVGYDFFDGKVFAPNGIQADVMAPYDLPVEKIFVTVGQHVGKGAPLVKLTMPGVQESLTIAQANRSTAKAAYDTALSAQSERVTNAAATLKQMRDEEAAAKADAANGGTADVNAAVQARVDAEKELAAAKAERDSNTWGERQALEAANSYLADIRAGTNQGIIRSPIAGTVTRLEAKSGMQATAKQTLATVVNLEKLQIQGTVPPEMAQDVKKGSKVLVALDGANSDPFEGEVSDISVLPPSEGQASPGYLAVIAFDNRKGVVQLGAKIKRLGLRTGTVDDALVVPVGAISKNAQGQMVAFVKDGTNWIERPVEVGITDGALIQIKSGVKEGDSVQVREITVSS